MASRRVAPARAATLRSGSMRRNHALTGIPQHGAQLRRAPTPSVVCEQVLNLRGVHYVRPPCLHDGLTRGDQWCNFRARASRTLGVGTAGERDRWTGLAESARFAGCSNLAHDFARCRTALRTIELSRPRPALSSRHDGLPPSARRLAAAVSVPALLREIAPYPTVLAQHRRPYLQHRLHNRRPRRNPRPIPAP